MANFFDVLNLSSLPKDLNGTPVGPMDIVSVDLDIAGNRAAIRAHENVFRILDKTGMDDPDPIPGQVVALGKASYSGGITDLTPVPFGTAGTGPSATYGVDFTADGTSDYLATFNLLQVGLSGANLRSGLIQLKDGSTVLDEIFVQGDTGLFVPGPSIPIYLDSPTAGVHTLTATAQAGEAGTTLRIGGTTNATPMTIVVTKVT